MTASPATMVRQIAVAREVNRVEPNRLAYRTSTGDAPRVEHTDQPADWEEPHCFVCKRHTDHFAEHDDMVEAGTARYGDDGSVYPI